MSRSILAGRITRGVILAASLAAAVSAPRVRADDAVAQPAISVAQAAVGQAIAMDGGTYAGDCSATQSPRDLGAICSRFVAAQAGVYAFETGRTFSEFDRWVFVAPAAGAWAVVATAPFDDSVLDAGIPWPSAAPAGP